MEEKLQEILPKVTETFMKFGIKSVTMDDIARNLRISKKTLYQFVSDKNDLVSKCIKHEHSEDKCRIKEILDRNLNAIDEMFAIMEMVSEQLKQVHPSIFYDLEKYYPEAWNEFHSFKNEFVFDIIRNNIEKGKSEGHYRADVNAVVIARMYVNRMDDLWNPDVFPPSEFKFHDLYLEVMRYHIRGIASQEGIDYLVQKVKKQIQA
jgi:AcrR family transcriptional regulator